MNWINIKSEKPKEGQAIVVWLKKTKNPPNAKTAIYSVSRCYSNNGVDGELKLVGEYENFRGLDYDDMKSVTHWQPLSFKKPR